jgi:hypothetical protein
MPSKPKPKPKAKGTSSASKPRTAAVKSKSPPKAGARVKPAAVGGDWRAQTLERMRSLIKEADPEMIEERKWVKPTKPLGVPVWSHDGIVCTGETYKQVVKLTFMYGASLPDPARLFNSSLEGGTRRALDIPEGAQVDARAFKALIKAAVALNTSKKKR